MSGELKPTYVTDVSVLDSAFNLDEEKKKVIAGIRGTFDMPRPGTTEKLRVRVLMYEEPGKAPTLIKIVPAGTGGGAFKTDAYYLNAIEVDDAGNDIGKQKDLRMSTTLWQGITSELTNNGVSTKDLVGRVIDVTSAYWLKAPINKRGNPPKVCERCKGAKCDFCNHTGLQPPTRYEVALVNPVAATKMTSSQMEF
jgi:hypothetical protein